MASGRRADDEKVIALRSALVHAVGIICEGEGGLEMEPEAVATLSFVVEQYFKILSCDLPAFAHHAKRSSIGVDDVLLVARGNPDILARLNDFVDTYNLRTVSKKKKTEENEIERTGTKKARSRKKVTTTTTKASTDGFDDEFFDDDYDDDDESIGRKAESGLSSISGFNKENCTLTSSNERPPSSFF